MCQSNAFCLRARVSQRKTEEYVQIGGGDTAQAAKKKRRATDGRVSGATEGGASEPLQHLLALLARPEKHEAAEGDPHHAGGHAGE